MAQVKCNEPGDWRDAPFLVVLYDYTMKNAEFPSDIGTLIAYVLVLIVSWYVVLWTARFLLSLVWPVIIVMSAFLLFRFLRPFQHEDLGDIVFHILTYVVDTATFIIERIFEFLASVVQ